MNCMDMSKVLCIASVLVLSAAANAADPAADRAERDVMMAPFYTGTVYPTPQKATYTESFAPLSSVGILLGDGIEEDDRRVAVLMDRVARYGGKASFTKTLSAPCATAVCIGGGRAADALLSARRVPDRPQGYLIHAVLRDGKHTFVLQGRDGLGLLWAIVSWNQLVTRRNGEAVVQVAEVEDYPVNLRRGGKISAHPALLRFSVWAKMDCVEVGNAFTYRTPPLRNVPNLWRKKEMPKRAREYVRQIGQELTPLGITWYAGLNPLARRKTINQPRCKNEEDIQALMRHALWAAENGGGFSLYFDDFRFPMQPDDERDFGSAREADIYLLNRLHQALKESYPRAKMRFCPPFYWGPDGQCRYSESREEYLKAMGERVPKDIGIFWTGPRVKSSVVSKEQVRWITDLIQRRPVFWQNIRFAHSSGYHYCTDPVKIWPEWHYEGFFEDLEAYMLNTSITYVTPLWTLVDYQWNPEAYDAKRSIEEAAKHMFGPEAFPALVELNRKLSYFDPYGRRVTPSAARNLREMDQKVAEVDAAWQQFQTTAQYPGALSALTQMEWFVEAQRRFIAALKKNPALAQFAGNAEEAKRMAAAEVALDLGRDTFLSPYDFTGGYPARYYANRCEKRLATWIYGSQTVYPAMKTQFEADPFPPEGDYDLILSAQDDETEKQCRIRIAVNETTIFEGENGFARNGWSRRTFTIPAGALKRYNTLLIQCRESLGSYGGPPFFMLNYAVLRKGQ